MAKILINEEKCSGCGNCVVSCVVNSKNPETAAGKPQMENAVIFIIDGKCKILNENLCLGCGMCMKACPGKYISVIREGKK